MTDKIQKIKDWISKEQDGLMDAQGNFEYSEHEGAYHILCNLDTYIDSLQEEPVSNPIDFEKELYKAFGQVKDFTLGMQIAKWFYDMGKNSQEPVSEELEEASKNYALNNTPWDDCKDEIQESFKAGAKWQETKDESITKDLGEYISELSKQFPEVSFAKLSRIAVRVAKWQEQKYKEALNIYLNSQWNKGK